MSKHVKFALYGVAAMTGVFLLLSFVGQFLISEVVTEVTIEKGKDVLDAKIGSPAPYFELPDLSGTKIKSTDFLGKPIILTFWASWNEESANQIKILDDYQLGNRVAKLSAAHFMTVNSQEDKSAVLNFMLRGNYKAQVFLDESGETTEKYGARNLPTTYFLDKEGVIREIFIGVLNEKMLVEKTEKLLAQ